MKKCYVIGVFPPPYGGVTVKCKLFCDWIKGKNFTIDTVDLHELKRNKARGIHVLADCLKAFMSDLPIVYCIDSKRLGAMLALQSLFKKSLKRTTVLAVGGVFPQVVKQKRVLRNALKHIKGVWVETEGMKQQMNDMGFSNVVVFPNPKSECGCCEPVENKNKKLRLVFFSQISKEKGILDIIKSIDLLDNNGDVEYEMDFYGHVNPEIQEQFEGFISNHKNIQYCGVFDSTKNDVYRHLNQYDILLLPTTWKAEGVPGILIEAKMAGLAIIASEHNYNSELVREDLSEGYLLKDDFPIEIETIIRDMNRDRDLLFRIKCASYKSRKRYAIEEYENLINNLL